jgi:hypothetical protein
MIENQKQLAVSKTQMEKLQVAVASFDVDYLAKKLGSRKLAAAELRALKSQIEELYKEIQDYESVQ